MKARLVPQVLLLIGVATSSAPAILAQNSIQLFGPVNVRLSQTDAGYGSSQVIFNSNTLNLTCPVSPYAILSSSNVPSPPAGSGNVLVDNNINVSNLTSGTGPTNVCLGGVNGSSIGPFENCFTSSYQTSASAGNLTGSNPDAIVSSGGVPPIDISSQLIVGPQQIKIDLVDEGGYVASSSLYLNTNCTSGGVNGPAQITGNNIPPSNPTPTQLDQDFTFNPITNQMIGFEYDLTGAAAANTLTIDPNGSIPQVGDSALEPLIAYPQQVSGTSFATSMCLIHDGEKLNGLPACKLYTLECTNGTGSTSSGAQCPASSAPNETMRDVFDGPAFTLPDILTPSGVTFHEGMGLLMASEGWTGGPCTFDPASGLQDLPCPQNLLTSFTGPGSFSSGGQTTKPNSTFISIAQVPEDLTTVTVTDSTGNPVALGGGIWTNSANPYVKLSSQPPNLTGTNLPAAANFVASPIQSITYGISSGIIPPAPGTTSATDTVLASGACGSSAAVFTPQPQQLSNLSDGSYLLHYFAKDCAGTEELKFLMDNSGSWSTNFYTYQINVDSTAPSVVSGPTLSPAGPYYQGQIVTAKFECTDALSGIVSCGGKTFATPTADTGLISLNLTANASGTFTATAVDAAGNQSSQSANYQVNIDGQIHLTISPTTVVYPLGTNLAVQMTNLNGHVPTGTIKIMDQGTTVTTLTLSSGAVYYYLKGLSAGTHSLTAVYSGDKFNVAGTSAAVVLNVTPVPVTLSPACWNTPYPYGANFQCTVSTSSNSGAPLGSITYSYDGGPSVSVALASGSANITVPKPPVGNHSLVIAYPAQTNYAAAGPSTQNFVVTSAPVVVQFTPSTWYLTKGSLTLTAAVQSWSAGPPKSIGSVTFTRGTTVIGTAPVNASGVASITVAATSLPNGNDTLTATYSGGANYATGSTSITVQVAH